MGDAGRKDADPGRPVLPARGITPRRGEAPVADGTTEPHIPFNRACTTGREFEYIREAIANLHLSGNGPFTARSEELLTRLTGARSTYLTHSCTAALEMAALLLDVGPGDEVIVPSFTFSTTASAFALRGATIVFVDIRPDTLNIDEEAFAAAIGDRTKAIVAVHYAGVACDLDPIIAAADERGIVVIEDAAQALLSTYKGRPLGSIGQLGAISFHETKNVTCGEGGALLVNGEEWIGRAEIVQEKGTNRRAFYRGQVDKYTWVGLGSSYAPSEINAAFLLAQLEQAEELTRERLRVWNAYHDAFEDLEERQLVRRPIVPQHCVHNGHMYYLLAPTEARRDALIAHLAERDINAVFHYVPLHDAPAGRAHGRPHGMLRVTNDVSTRLVRLPMWVGMDDAIVDRIVSAVCEALA